jgi:hypothetical protein
MSASRRFVASDEDDEDVNASDIDLDLLDFGKL